MLGLPKSTEFNKRIPKQKFYDNLTVSPAFKRSFIDEVKVVYWANKIAPSTVNIAEGKNVTEVEIFRIRLNARQINENILRQIDREIPYHILFVLEYENLCQAWIGYKEAAGSRKAAFKVDRYYHTEWVPENSLPIKLEALDMDAGYANFVRQVAGDELQEAAPGETLKTSVERNDRIDALQKQINRLQVKIRREKQLNRQMEMNAKIKRLKKEVEALTHG